MMKGMFLLKKALLTAGITILGLAVLIVMPYCLLKSSFDSNDSVDHKNIQSISNGHGGEKIAVWLSSEH
ncbi:inner membrane protein involved in colicin E2 resistance [Kurthia huakuii]|uniref:hypothetical protein n=1 Tax=Kurthia huakuii TaxID=1421019 RepID=UPI0012691EA5|nr:hypothetical protein [Kurthia huakuii]MBM7699858.1 inner membrane protein involved in colicin E2 resistance [Kurthia huakuii]